MTKEKENNWYFIIHDDRTDYYCGDCGREANALSQVQTRTREGKVKIISITCPVCLKIEEHFE